MQCYLKFDYNGVALDCWMGENRGCRIWCMV